MPLQKLSLKRLKLKWYNLFSYIFLFVYSLIYLIVDLLIRLLEYSFIRYILFSFLFILSSLFFPLYSLFYSVLNASIGFTLIAVIAGINPAKSPDTTNINNAITTTPKFTLGFTIGIWSLFGACSNPKFINQSTT